MFSRVFKPNILYCQLDSFTIYIDFTIFDSLSNVLTQYMKRLNYLYLLTVIILSCAFQFTKAQTVMYKRIMTVMNGNKQATNDDAHYITFNDKGCYESDKNGISDNGNKFIKFIKNENNLHCYYGNGFFGNAFYYFSSDYSRLNIKMDDIIYVYTKEISLQTTASLRKKQATSPSDNTIIAPTPIIVYENNNSNSSSTPSTKLHRNMCNYCKGTRVDPSPTYGPDYTGEADPEYCNICHAMKDRHYHTKCPSCGGKGYYETRY